MSAADGLVRNEEVAGATPATLTISGRQADISWLRLSRKQDRHRRGRSVTDAFRQLSRAKLALDSTIMWVAICAINRNNILPHDGGEMIDPVGQSNVGLHLERNHVYTTN